MYLYELPTTGAFSFAEVCIDQSSSRSYANRILETTQVRANIRAALKTSKRTDDSTKDYLALVKLLEEYIPLVRGIVNCVAHDDLGLKSEPSFSWRTTLSNNILHNSPRLSIPGLYADLAFTLLTYAFTLSNLAHATVHSIGPYEHDRTITEVQRKRKDEQLNVAFGFLSKASGVFAYIADTLLPEWEISRAGGLIGVSRPPDLRQEVNTALVKMSLADAQSIAIRKYQSKAAYESNITPGPPLPKSHPSPGMIAKLHLECVALYSSAKSLAKASASGGNGEVSAELRKYLTDKAAFHTALSHKWLGIEAGENGGTDRGGEAVAFLAWAKKELEGLKDSGLTLQFSKGEKAKEKQKQSQVVDELESVNTFYKYYQKMNDSLHFQPIPSQADLQTRIPTGLAAAQIRPYNPPVPAYGPGSLEDVRRQTDKLDLEEQDSGPAKSSTQSPRLGNYAGAGSYF